MYKKWRHWERKCARATQQVFCGRTMGLLRCLVPPINMSPFLGFFVRCSFALSQCELSRLITRAPLLLCSWLEGACAHWIPFISGCTEAETLQKVMALRITQPRKILWSWSIDQFYILHEESWKIEKIVCPSVLIISLFPVSLELCSVIKQRTTNHRFWIRIYVLI